MRVAIIGAGPSAAFAYRACWENNLNPTVYASQFSNPTGAFYIHEMPPACPSTVLAQYRKKVSWVGLGTENVYAEKMWGDPHVKTSFPATPRIDIGYDPAIISWLWTDVILKPCGKLTDAGVAKLALRYDLVIQTFPTDQSKNHRTIEHIPVLTKLIEPMDNILLLYSGDNSPWTRIAFCGNTISVEYPKTFPVTENLLFWSFSSVPDLPPETKRWTKGPADNVKLIGRFAQYDRKMLSHHAYKKTLRLLKRRM